MTHIIQRHDSYDMGVSDKIAVTFIFFKIERKSKEELVKMAGEHVVARLTTPRLTRIDSKSKSKSKSKDEGTHSVVVSAALLLQRFASPKP
jgi:hypothetical protein